MSARSHGRSIFAGARITRGALYLLFAEVGLSLVALFLDDDAQHTLLKYVAVTPESVWGEGKVWTLFTGTFLTAQFLSLVFHGLLLWMFIPELERWWGTKRFLVFALATSLLANLVGTGVGALLGDGYAVMGGLDAFIWAGIVAYGTLFPRHPVRFFGAIPMTGKQLAIGMVAFAGLFVVLQGRWATGAGWAAALVLAWGLSSGKVSPKLWWLQFRHKRARRHLHIVPPASGSKNGAKRWMN